MGSTILAPNGYRVTRFVAILLLVAGLCATACDSSSGVANDVLRKTVPAGDLRPTLSGPVQTGQSLQFTWEFETHLGASAYTEWLVRQLHDYRIVERDPSQLRLAKGVTGDAYLLMIALEPINTRTYVRVTFSALPD